jgi:peroxiredoxin
MPEQGDKAPDFSLLDQDGTHVNHADLSGRKAPVYLHPGR